MVEDKCIFCEEYETKCEVVNGNERHLNILYENYTFWGKDDPNPVSPEHYLLIPKRHVEDFHKLSIEEQMGFFEAVKYVVERMYGNNVHNPDGHTIGINQKKAAGQTIPHLHVHIFSRRWGDVENPRGGVRNIIPGKGNY